MLYLESGSKPIRFTLMARRLMFLHYILNEDDNSLIFRCFKVQNRKPCKDDWCEQISQDMEYLDIFLTQEQIKMSSRQQFKRLVDDSIHKKSFLYLNEEKKKLRKVSHIEYEEFELQHYLKNKEINNQMAKFIFVLRCRMLDISANFKNKVSSKWCPVCEDENTEDNQEHLLICPQLVNHQLVLKIPKYENLFGNNNLKQMEVAAIIYENYTKRKKKIQD